MIGDELRAMREARGWTVAELAGKSGVSDDTIRRMEADDGQPRAATMRRLRAALAGSALGNATGEDADLGRLVRAWHEADAQGRRAIAAVADAVAGFAGVNEDAPAGAV